MLYQTSNNSFILSPKKSVCVGLLPNKLALFGRP